MLLGLGTKVFHVDVAIDIGLDDDDSHARHHGTGGIGPMRRLGNQTHIAVPLSPALMVLPNDKQSSVLTLRPRIRLQRDFRKACYLGKRLLELPEHHPIPFRLINRRERMDHPYFRPRYRDHLARGVQLHRTRSKGDHREVERDVLILKTLHVPEHLRLGMMAIEYRMGHVGGCPFERFRIADHGFILEVLERHIILLPSVEDVEQVGDVIVCHRLIK